MSKFSFSFGNPTNKTVTGTPHMWGLLIANHLDQSEILSNLLHSVLEVHNCVAPFTRDGKLHAFGAEKPISWAKLTYFDFFPMYFPVSSHILSTIGDALSTLANSTLIILFSEMLKFSNFISSKLKNIVKEIVDI